MENDSIDLLEEFTTEGGQEDVLLAIHDDEMSVPGHHPKAVCCRFMKHILPGFMDWFDSERNRGTNAPMMLATLSSVVVSLVGSVVKNVDVPDKKFADTMEILRQSIDEHFRQVIQKVREGDKDNE